MHIEKKNLNNLYKRMFHEIYQLELKKISISLHVIADFVMECNFHINLFKVTKTFNPCIPSEKNPAGTRFRHATCIVRVPP